MNNFDILPDEDQMLDGGYDYNADDFLLEYYADPVHQEGERQQDLIDFYRNEY